MSKASTKTRGYEGLRHTTSLCALLALLIGLWGSLEAQAQVYAPHGIFADSTEAGLNGGTIETLSPLLLAPFQPGDVFAAVASGNVNRFSGAGVFQETLSTTGSGFTTGMCFDKNMNLYVTMFGEGRIAILDSNGAFVSFIEGDAGDNQIESCLFDAAGNLYAGVAGGDQDIRKYNVATGTLIQKFNVATGPRGSDWIDLSADQCTMLYTSEGFDIYRYDVCTDTQLANFTTGTLTGGAAYALRILPDGTVLVANSGDIKRLDAGGNVIQTYDVAGENAWFALNLDGDGTSFWSGDFGTSRFYKFDIATGAVLIGPVSTGTGSSTFFGLTVKGEITVSDPCADAQDHPPFWDGTLTSNGDGTGFMTLEAVELSKLIVLGNPSNNLAFVEVQDLGGTTLTDFTGSDPISGTECSGFGRFEWTGDATLAPDQVNLIVCAPEQANTSFYLEFTDQCDQTLRVDPVMQLFATATDTEVTNVPVSFELSQNYPNPFNPTTTIRYALPEAADVQVSVFDMLGKEVASLTRGYQAAGRYEVRFNAEELSAGVYLYVIEAGSFKATRHMVLLK